MLGETTVGRVRLISPALDADADLETVDRAGHPVIACLALFGTGDRFARSDGLRLPPRGRARWSPSRPGCGV